MSQIVLSQEQANLLAQASGPIYLRDPNGNVVGTANREVWFTEEEIAEAKRRLAAKGPRRTAEQVMERLRSLESQ